MSEFVRLKWVERSRIDRALEIEPGFGMALGNKGQSLMYYASTKH